MKLIFSHPTGNANVRAAVSAFFMANILEEFHTTIATYPGSLFEQLGDFSPLSEFKRRRFDPDLKPFTKVWPGRELVRCFFLKAGVKSMIAHENGMFCVDAVYKSLDRRVASKLKFAQMNGASALYAYDDGAYFSFREAKRLGFQCFFDLPTGHWRAARRLLESERERRPEWAPTITGLLDSEAKLARKDEELQLADRIFVASSFTANSLNDYPGELAPIEVIPYGFPPALKKREYSNTTGRKALKLLFVGKLSQQKGIAELFEAVEGLNHLIELTIVGRKVNQDCPALDAALAKHKWISTLPHDSVLKLMRESDVLIFPSLFDGFGLVITEAMAQGTPVITTERSAGPDLIQHGQNGWLFKAGFSEELRVIIEDLLKDPKVISEAGQAALETASKRPWRKYQEELAEAVMRHKMK